MKYIYKKNMNIYEYMCMCVFVCACVCFLNTVTGMTANQTQLSVQKLKTSLSSHA